MGTVHYFPTWRKPPLTLDFTIPPPQNGEVLRGGLDNSLRVRVLENPGRADQKYGSPMPLLRFLARYPLLFL